MKDKQLKAKSVAAINAALKEYREDSYVEPPMNVVGINDYKEKLSRHQIDQAVIAFVHALNLSGGSVGEMDLYKLIRIYLCDGEARAKINAVVDHHHGF